MKKIIYTSLFILCLGFASCEDFLDRTPISNMNEDDFYQSDANTELLINAAYATLHELYGPQSLMSYFGELMSDNVITQNVILAAAERRQFQDGKVTANNITLKGYWDTYYTSLYRVNNALSRLPADAKASQAGLRFLRALYYFDMIRAWDNVALVTTPLSIEEAYKVALSSSDKVYEQIIVDLKFAIENLKEKGDESLSAGVPTKGAAKTLLGKVYLTKKNKTEAATILRDVVTSGKYSLVSYADLWDLKKKNSNESIFEIQYRGGANNPYSLYWSYFTPYENGEVTAWGYGDNQVSNDLWNAYESSDIRRDLSIASYEKGVKNDKGEVTLTTFRYAIKWKDENAALDNDRHEMGDNNFIVLRYADVLLMLAEATGETSHLNEVRDRVGLPLYGSPEYPTSLYGTVALAIEHERQVEFALEFHRFFDLKRTDRAIDVMKASSKKSEFDTNNLYLPIPQAVLDQNPNLIKQNPGY
ncbi:RagB/SusD family nutrient uptake outer membrane protein [termite gut metagenome]|uniref:RagB/SusD family nutrient uptake outer membrane protein n=2 Tax=termite gut metagenome TaxID=433724 RepID=A0A5J4SUB8_9ZZZZ